jgi:hypothetical protein
MTDSLYSHTPEQWDIFCDMMMQDVDCNAYTFARALVAMGGDRDTMYGLADRWRWSFGRWRHDV